MRNVAVILADDVVRRKKTGLEGQMSLFDFVGEEDKKDYEVHYPNVEEFPKEVLLGFEKEVLGIYLSGHPLEDYLGKMKKNVTANAADFVREEESGTIRVTDDGSYGFHGNGSQQLQALVDAGNTYDCCVAIGPMIMMKFTCLLTKKLEIPTIVSMNPIMVDGTGMCGACRLIVDGKVKFACVDGPEFDGHLVDFDQAMKRQQQYKTEEGRAKLAYEEGATHHGGCGNCGGDK